KNRSESGTDRDHRPLLPANPGTAEKRPRSHKIPDPRRTPQENRTHSPPSVPRRGADQLPHRRATGPPALCGKTDSQFRNPSHLLASSSRTWPQLADERRNPRPVARKIPPPFRFQAPGDPDRSPRRRPAKPEPRVSGVNRVFPETET